jgi:hypothetical protein
VATHPDHFGLLGALHDEVVELGPNL